jgi:deoxycytidine triphosphate deaminase
MLNASQIIEEGLLKLEHTQGKVAQVGYDLTLKQVNKIGTPPPAEANSFKIGKVLRDSTQLTNYTTYGLMNLDGVNGWLLYPGTYDLTFNEGCKIPDNRVAFIKQRSSLYRNGAVINSPVFDPGFETEFMGTMLFVHETIFIEENARVAQIYFHECQSAKKYNGQWQGDKQRS